MPPNLSISALNRLGERLRRAGATREDLSLLSLYRDGFDAPTVEVTEIITRLLFCKATIALRPSKSTVSIVAKLIRERSRLSQMQDIGGLRVIVAKASQQNRLTALMLERFPTAALVDRRIDPRSGYRAVHIIVTIAGRPIEVQIRTTLQNAWAQYSEKLADRYGVELKYGGGPEAYRNRLDAVSRFIAVHEDFEIRLERLKGNMNSLYRKQREGNLQAHELLLIEEYRELQARQRAERTRLQSMTKQL